MLTNVDTSHVWAHACVHGSCHGMCVKVRGTDSGIGPHFPLVRDSLTSTEHSRLAGPQASGDSLVPISTFWRNMMGLQMQYGGIQLSMSSEGADPSLRACSEHFSY